MNQPTPSEPVLYLDMSGEEITLRPGSDATFGRAGDIVVDEDNRGLHRILGCFQWRAGHWWVVNLGSSIPLELLNADGPGNSVIAPGQSAVIGYDEFILRFVGGPTTYEMLGSGDLAPDTTVLAERLELGGDLEDETTTVQWDHFDLNDEQRLLLIGLAQHILRRPSEQQEVPTSRALAHQLGWTMPKLNRKLDHLCQKLDRAGVKGLRGDLGEAASARRLRLARHAVDARLVTRDQLDLLDRGSAEQARP